MSETLEKKDEVHIEDASKPIKDTESASIGSKRKSDQIETDKENDGAKTLNKSDEKRVKATENTEEQEKVVSLQHKGESASTKEKQDDDEEEIIDTA